jgi:hypothetical protein
MTDKKPKAELDRRRFLLGVSAGATAVATVQIGSAQPAHAYDPGPEETKARYQETNHVKAYYRVNGYE